VGDLARLDREDEASEAMMTTSANTSETCAFPGCERPVRPKAGDGGGKPPIYCDLINPSGKYAHTSLSAAREQAKLEKAGTTRQPVVAEVAVEAPASAARGRAAGLLDQFRAEIGQMTGTLQAAVEAMTSASSPESVSAELTAARRQVERSRLETAEQIAAAEAAEAARDQALAEVEATRTEIGEAKAARDEAIAELETAEAELAELRQELEQVRADHAAQLERLNTEHADELRRVRTEAADQVRAAQTEAAKQVAAAETARDQAQAEATAARQAVTDATRRADEAREELRQARTEHRNELAELRQEHRDEMAAERQRADAMRAEHHREINALQQTLAALHDHREQDTVSQPLGGDQNKRR
jgi:colicin import membrane protein